jgi:hypothetical protein
MLAAGIILELAATTCMKSRTLALFWPSFFTLGFYPPAASLLQGRSTPRC